MLMFMESECRKKKLITKNWKGKKIVRFHFKILTSISNSYLKFKFICFSCLFCLLFILCCTFTEKKNQFIWLTFEYFADRLNLRYFVCLHSICVLLLQWTELMSKCKMFCLCFIHLIFRAIYCT